MVPFDAVERDHSHMAVMAVMLRFFRNGDTDVSAIDDIGECGGPTGQPAADEYRRRRDRDAYRKCALAPGPARGAMPEVGSPLQAGTDLGELPAVPQPRPAESVSPALLH